MYTHIHICLTSHKKNTHTGRIAREQGTKNGVEGVGKVMTLLWSIFLYRFDSWQPVNDILYVQSEIKWMWMGWRT